MSWLRIILDMLASLFRWRANATDPAVAYRKEYAAWQKEFAELERETEAAHNDWQSAVTSGLDTHTELFAVWQKRADALHRCRTRQPKSPAG